MAEIVQDATHFMDYWRMVKSRKEVVIAVFLFVVVAGIVVTLLMPKVYMASTRIKVRQDMPEVTPFQQAQQKLMSIYDMYFLKTEFEIIQSRPILYEVIGNLRLREQFGRMYSDDGTPLSLAETYKMLCDSMKVQQYRDTNLIEISICRSSRRTTRDAARRDAQKIANEIASVYRDHRMKQNRDETGRGVMALREAYQAQQKKVEMAESALETLRKDLNVSMVMGSQPGTASSLDNAKLERLELNRIQARKSMLDRKTRFEEMTRLKGSELLYSMAYVVQDPALAALRQQLTEAEANFKKRQEMFGERHPDVVGALAVVNDLKRKIDETVQGQIKGLSTDYEIAKRDFEAAESDLEAARMSDITAHSTKYLPFAKAESEVMRQRQLRDTLELELVQKSIELDLPRTPVEVVDPAEMPEENDPVSPKLLLNIILSIVMGLGCGIGLVFFIEYMDTSVKTVEDIEQYIGASIVGVIPQKVRPLVEEGPDSPHAEAYRVLRMNMELSKKMGGGNVLCLTSGGAGEGKSLTLFNLACVCAQTGKTVLVIDSDLRRPTQHKMFKISNRMGLADVLLGTATLDDSIHRAVFPNMDFLSSGKLPSTMHGTMNAQKLRDIINHVRGRYDYVFFDSPPIMGVSDASILSSEADAVMLVVQHRSYPRAVSLRAKNMVENVGGNLIGVVLNNLNVARDYYYYYHSDYYNYAYGGKRGDKRREAMAPRSDAAARAVKPSPGEGAAV